MRTASATTRRRPSIPPSHGGQSSPIPGRHHHDGHEHRRQPATPGIAVDVDRKWCKNYPTDRQPVGQNCRSRTIFRPCPARRTTYAWPYRAWRCTVSGETAAESRKISLSRNHSGRKPERVRAGPGAINQVGALLLEALDAAIRTRNEHDFAPLRRGAGGIPRSPRRLRRQVGCRATECAHRWAALLSTAVSVRGCRTAPFPETPSPELLLGRPIRASTVRRRAPGQTNKPRSSERPPRSPARSKSVPWRVTVAVAGPDGRTARR